MQTDDLRRREFLGVGLWLAAAAPLPAFAQATDWEFFEPRPREFSRIRRG